MYKIEFEDAAYFKEILKALQNNNDEAVFTITPYSISYIQMDPSRVSLILLEIAREAFWEFHVDKEEKICLNLDQMIRHSFKKLYKNDSLKIEGDVEKLTVTLKGSINRNFNVPLIDLDEIECPIPKVPFTSEVTLTMKALKQIFDDIEDDSNVNLAISKENFIVEQTTDLGNYHVKLEKYGEHLLELKVNEEAKCNYSSGYLKSFINSTHKLSDIIDVSFATDLPLKMNVRLPFPGKLEYWVAPRIEY